jgi:(E)-4-hydroxy-3-methylbut-2-enyl-diphosphate synthase
LTGATPSNLIYIGGEPDHKVSNQDFVDHLESVIRERAEIIEAKRAEREANIISSTH